MKIIVDIGGREAIPVRAIPLATNWETLSPDELAGVLAKSDEHSVAFRGLVAYRLEDGEVAPIRAIYWENFPMRALLAVHEQLNAMEAAGTITYEEGYQRWRQASLPLLPPGAFVWRDDFERRYTERYGPEGESWLADPYDGDGMEDEPPRAIALAAEREARVVLDFNPFVHSADVRALVMEGFEALSKASTAAIASGVVIPHAIVDVAESQRSDHGTHGTLMPSVEGRLEARKSAILAALFKLGHDPLKLQRLPGKPGPKAEVKAMLGNKGIWTGDRVFIKAWDALRDEERIADA